MKRDDIYYEALKTRDPRFDGKFFVGVKTTGIYCRPICPAKPKRENVEFFPNHLEAERNGYRPCLRCRPESAPQSPIWIGKSAVVRRAVRVLNHGDSFEFNEDRFAEFFGMTARHLRRIFIEEIGKTPKRLAFENRLNLARKLVTESSLSLSEIAFASGFRSIRRFNDAFRDRFKKAPREMRRSPLAAEGLVISIPYRPPFDFAGLLRSYRSHRVGKLERFTETKMTRVIEFGGKTGEIKIENDPANSRLLVEIDFPDTSVVHLIISRVRTLFDLDSDPIVVANSLEVNDAMKKLVRKHPGIRMPSGWDPFEVAIATILGQLVSVERGRTLVGDLIGIAGRDSGRKDEDGGPIRLFPTPKEILAADLSSLKTTSIRRQTLIAFSKAILEGSISLEPTQDVDEFIQSITKIRGIGPWTADYIALKVLRHTDAFPSTDLVLAKALEIHSKKTLDRMSPWRAYAAALFWKEYTT